MKKSTLSGIAISFAIFFTSCNNSTNNQTTTTEKMETKAGVTKTAWGNTDGKEVFLYTITNAKGVQVKISNYGATITSWVSPDKNNKPSSIVLGFDSLSGYLAKPPYFGAVVGRYGNRIAKGKFKIDKTEYTLATNNGPNALHGGLKGFDKQVWDATPASDSTASIELSYLSKDGEEGYPGNLKVAVRYTLTDDNELKIEYSASTDKATVLNVTNHSYFNLTGDVNNSILDHTLMIDADNYTPVDTTLIPTGEIKSVKGTPFDFTKAKKIGLEIGAVSGGYDHNFVLNKKDSSLSKIVELKDSISGRTLEVYTTQPGVQFYTGNFLDGKFSTPDGKKINQHAAMCLETQHFPDSPNEPKFPTTLLLPGQQFHSVTVYKLSVK
ncbi:aldose epimerase family protein [Ferruginibacter paludis]|uniref:aldose epimerase family protein n=1 Tax=Ferruginibacter paludis TaxID=1310417 RepID=UPI0025B4201D|nr:aldose epimerase family protein [Ferruginibacter paludis]MDN3655702.1 aldose epimerase family protein [Ferruginibacter paludis]